MTLKLFADGCAILVRDLSSSTPAKVGVSNGTPYALDGVPEEKTNSRHAVEVRSDDGKQSRVLLTAADGFTRVHANSALAHGQRLVVAVGARLCALRLPNLELEWNVVVDEATCFGVYRSEKYASYVTHGELAITRVADDGTVLWSSSGKDIFTEGFTLEDDHVIVVDFEHETYRIDLATGHTKLLERA